MLLILIIVFVGQLYTVHPVKCCMFQCLRKVAKFVMEQNERVYMPRGLLLTSPVERGLRVVSFDILNKDLLLFI